MGSARDEPTAPGEPGRATSPAGERLVAAIDIGTNSVLLLIARASAAGQLEPIVERATITRLGEGVDKARELAPQAVERTLACLSSYARTLTEHGVTVLAAVGTSAMRDARGGEDFRARAAQLLGSEPRVISGAEEARLTFTGGLSGIAPESLGPVGRDVVVFDIGGGSTELIRGNPHTQTTHTAVSLDVGSVRLTERHVTHDPPLPAELLALEADIQRTLATGPSLAGAALVGVAGTVTTIAAIAGRVAPYDARAIHGSALSVQAIERTVALLQSLPLAQRVALPGLSEKRADVIIAGAMLCLAIVRQAGAAEIRVSDRGVRWGLAAELAG